MKLEDLTKGARVSGLAVEGIATIKSVEFHGSNAMEVLEHLSVLPGAEVQVTLELRVSVPDGVKEDTVRTVSENAKTLKFGTFSFERE